MTQLQALNILGLDLRRAVKENIKAAYRAKAKLLHPDKGGDAAKFKELVAAYELLTGRAQSTRVARPVRVYRQPEYIWPIFRVYRSYTVGTTTVTDGTTNY